jgi:hypothetical protein
VSLLLQKVCMSRHSSLHWSARTPACVMQLGELGDTASRHLPKALATMVRREALDRAVALYGESRSSK